MTIAAQPRATVEGDACGFRAQLPAALARRGIGEGVSVKIDDASIELDIRGKRRRVPRSPSCAADLDLVVLIVERQLKQLALAPDERPLPELDTLELSMHLDVGASGGVQVGERAFGELELAGRVELWRFLEINAGARLVLPSSAPVIRQQRTVGSLGAWALGAFVGAGVGFDAGRQRLFGGGTVGFERVEASSEGLFQTRDVDVFGLVATAEARLDVALLSERLWLSLRVGGIFRPSAPVFGVEGSSASFELPSAALSAKAGLWLRL